MHRSRTCPPSPDSEERAPIRRDVPLLVYDGACGFCRMWMGYWRRVTGDRVAYAPFQEVAAQFPQIPEQEFRRAAQLVLPDGAVLSGAAAMFRALAEAPDKGWWWRAYERLPGFKPVADGVYAVVSGNRAFAAAATAFLFGAAPQPATYAVATWLFLKGLGLVYLIAFVSFGVQILGLIGSNGILPADEFLGALRGRFGGRAFWLAPTVFWANAGDGMLRLVPILGAIAAILLILGIAPRPMLTICFALYLSLVTAGQDFMSFQWDILLLEAGFLAILLGSSSKLPIVLGWWLLFRLMFLSGAVKLLSGDAMWRDLTALTVHYETQPLPTVFGWFLHQLPAWFHRWSTIVTFAIELVVPFLIVTSRHLRFAAGFAFLAFELLIFATGNYTFFNLLTIALTLLLFDDAFWIAVLPTSLIERITAVPAIGALPNGLIAAIAVAILLLSAAQLWGVFTRRIPQPARPALAAIAPFHLVNTYGLFAVMTNPRDEIVVEGSADGRTWLPYEFRHKPGALDRAPTWVQPHQPRLDWQMWFAALGSPRSDPWFLHFAQRLLEGAPPVLRLLEQNPFPDQPPRFVRAQLYEYHFTNPATRRQTGAWWRREFKREYLPVISLRER